MDYQYIVNQIKRKKSFLCIGLDSDIEKLPTCVKGFADPVFEFNKQIIDQTHDLTVAYKPNTAFYEALGSKGWDSLIKTVDYIKSNFPEVFVIADAKRGDIGNTSGLYARAFLKNAAFDAITVAPYMGEDSVSPFLAFDDKWVILLALTSNKGAFDFQTITDGESQQKLFEKVLHISKNWAGKDKMMYVVGATKAEMLGQIRKIVPNSFLLVPGVGAQGGSLVEVAKYGLNENCGLLVNSSRGIIFADKSETFAKTARAKAMELQKQMETILEENQIVTS